VPSTTLEEAQRLVDHLTPLDQVHLAEYLIERIARAVASAQPAVPAVSSPEMDAWQKFFRLGDSLAEDDAPGTETLTQAVLFARR
jgi:hypothetical protein